MKIGGQANSDRVSPEDIEVFAQEASLGAALARRNVVELAELVRTKVGEIEQPDETAKKLATLIARRCESLLLRFKRT